MRITEADQKQYTSEIFKYMNSSAYLFIYQGFFPKDFLKF